MLINPRVETQTDIAWICDDCGTMLNEQAGVIKQEEAVRIARDLCQILQELHSLENPLIHKDIKPSNVMIMKNAFA